MRQATGEWLEPMIEAASSELLREAMRQARMPATETLDPVINDMAHRVENAVGSAASLSGVDWVRVGQLLRERLGWLDYPSEPPG